MYKTLRNILFKLDPEVSHELSLDMIGAAERLHLVKLFAHQFDSKPVEAMGIRFPNAVGLAAGLDKNGDYFNGLGQLGFGFVEIGTVTPLAQPGNPKPRLFRLTPQNAIINRMGFNNKGVDHLVENVKKRRYTGVLGINIGKNKVTPEDQALSDYEKCMDAVYPYADYITVNISSPNTPGLRNLQFGDALNVLLEGIKIKQDYLCAKYGKYKPVAVKIAPDMTEEEIQQVAKQFLQFEIDGVIATNTTVSRDGVEQSVFKDEAGGLSGAPVKDKSTRVISQLVGALEKKIPVIGVGGIMTGEDAKEKIDAGATLVQIYSGFIYRGPELVKEAAEAISL